MTALPGRPEEEPDRAPNADSVRPCPTCQSGRVCGLHGGIPAHLQATTSDRGLRYMPEITLHHGAIVSVYEASHADAPRLWLNVESPDRGGIVVAVDAVDAERLADQLRWLARNHYQGRAQIDGSGAGGDL